MTREQRETLAALLLLAAHVVGSWHGKPMRIAGGVLKVAHRKARTIKDIKTGEPRHIKATARVVWKGPRVTT